MNSLSYTLSEILAIIGGYFIASGLWFVMGVCHIRWGTKHSVSGLIMALLWIWYAYRNYDFFLVKGNIIDEQGFWFNVLGVIVLDVCSFYMALPYFKHVKNYLYRVFIRK